MHRTSSNYCNSNITMQSAILHEQMCTMNAMLISIRVLNHMIVCSFQLLVVCVIVAVFTNLCFQPSGFVPLAENRGEKLLFIAQQ